MPVRGKKNFGFLAAAIAALAVVLPCGGVLARETDSRKSLGVAALKNLTQNPDDNWIGVGFAEALTTKLKGVKALRVIERLQVEAVLRELRLQESGIVDTDQAVEVGRIAAVRYILTGSFQKAGEKLRVDVRAVDIETAEVLETESVKGGMEDIFDLQDQLALAMAEKLEVALGSEDRAAIAYRGTGNQEAFEAYSRGLEAFYKWRTLEALYEFQAAIKQDPEFAEAWAGLADSAIWLYFLDPGGRTSMLKTAGAAAGKAVELGPELAQARKAKGFVLILDGFTNNDPSKFETAEKELQRALEIFPEYADAHWGLWILYRFLLDRPEQAEAEYSRALDANNTALRNLFIIT